MSTIAARKPSGASLPYDKEQAHPESEKVNILVVDDLPEKLLAYRTILEELGQNLITVSSGEEALKLVLQQEFAVILLDVNMPGMDGFETASLIRQRKKSSHTPIIFLTAFTDEVYAAQGYASGAVDYLPTPVVPEVLRAKIRVFIELSQMRRQAALQAEERVRRTAAEESAHRSEFLVRASEILARAQNQGEIWQALVQLPMGYLADLSIIWLAGEERTEGIEWVSLEEGGEIIPHPFPSLSSIAWLETAISQAAATGQFQLLSEFPQSASLKGEYPPTPIFSQLGSALVLPLIVRGQTHGVLVLARKQSHAPYRQADISLASDLASRASVALENAMLIDRIKEADRRKDEFLGMLAHELRNPLAPIHNATQLLQILGTNEPRILQLRDIIERQVSHMVRLIDDLLDATRLSHGKILLRKERCDLVEILRQTVEDYRSIFDAADLQLKLDIPPGSLWVEGDPTRLVQAIGNLLHNAHKFTSPGGYVMVSLKLDMASRTAGISVRDTGIGIEPRMLQYVFDVFRQAEQGLDRSRGGLGLGLALVKGLVELHDGSVNAFSQGIGKGAEFIIRLPIATMQPAVVTPAPAVIPQGQKYRILVIEDNPDTAESARMLLDLDGYEVRTAYSGIDGLETARSFCPQVILCDIGLPGMDGYEVARTMRQDTLLSKTYIIALTGYGRDEDQRQAQEAGFDMHLIKPIDYNHLRRALASLPARVSQA